MKSARAERVEIVAASRYALCILLLSFLVFAYEYVQRATNNLWGDVAFSGWTAAIGHRLASGERIYRDFTLPLPPGGFAILAMVERLCGGGPAVLHESVICALCCSCLCWCAYLIARALANHETALFAAGGSVAWICGWPKELAYDYLAEVFAYGGIALLLRACAAAERREQEVKFLLVGVAAGLTLLFKQSTGMGLLAGAWATLAYLVLVAPSKGEAIRQRRTLALSLSAGALLGLMCCVVFVLLLHGSVSGFLQAVFVDGPVLKGGARFLLEKTIAGFAFEPAAVMSLGQIGIVALLTCCVVRRDRSCTRANADGSPFYEDRDTRFGIAVAVLVSSAAFVVGAILLATGAKAGLPGKWILPSFAVVQTGVFLSAIYFVLNVRAEPTAKRRQQFNVAVVSTLVLASAVSGSLADFRPLDEANATVVVVLVAVFGALGRGWFRYARPLVLLALMLAPLSSKLPRALMARNRVADSRSFWRGQRVNDGGLQVLKAAGRARAAAGPNGTVLVLPEDPDLVALIDRPRPPLCGAIVFVDQYPQRCLESDLSYLDSHPPLVIVTHPTAPADWGPVFRTWNKEAPAETLIQRFVVTHMAAYHHDATFHTAWAERQTALDIWVRN